MPSPLPNTITKGRSDGPRRHDCETRHYKGNVIKQNINFFFFLLNALVSGLVCFHTINTSYPLGPSSWHRTIRSIESHVVEHLLKNKSFLGDDPFERESGRETGSSPLSLAAALVNLFLVVHSSSAPRGAGIFFFSLLTCIFHLHRVSSSTHCRGLQFSQAPIIVCSLMS